MSNFEKACLNELIESTKFKKNNDCLIFHRDCRNVKIECPISTKDCHNLQNECQNL